MKTICEEFRNRIKEKNDVSLLDVLMAIEAFRQCGQYCGLAHLKLFADGSGAVVMRDEKVFSFNNLKELVEKSNELMEEDNNTEDLPYEIGYVQLWEESERGWGIRPDGACIALTSDDVEAYSLAFWNKERAENTKMSVPDEYSRERGKPFLVGIRKDLADELRGSEKHYLRLYEGKYSEFISKGKIKDK